MFKNPSRLLAVVTVALSSLVLASCGSSSSAPSTPSTTSTTTTTASGSTTMSPSNVTFDRLVSYMKSAKVCQGKTSQLSGKTLTAAEIKVHITAAIACQTKSTLTLIDYFDTPANMVALTSQKNFITAAGCAAHQYNCAVDEAGKWLFVGLISNKYKSLIPAGEAIMKVDQRLMDPALVNQKA